MTEKEIQNIIEPIIGQLVWGVKQGYGSFLSLEFGNPKIDFSGIKKPLDKGRFPFNNFENRHVTIKGDHTFFVNMANWKIYANESELAYDESERNEIEFALSFINGQKLKKVIIDSNQKTTEFEFDLGGIIKISNENYSDEINEMWNFYTESEKVLTYRNDGKACYENAKNEYGKDKFKEITEKITCPNTIYSKH